MYIIVCKKNIGAESRKTGNSFGNPAPPAVAGPAGNAAGPGVVPLGTAYVATMPDRGAGALSRRFPRIVALAAGRRVVVCFSDPRAKRRGGLHGARP